MEIIRIDEQEIINAVCVHMANKNRTMPDNVMVELIYDDEVGYSAELEINGLRQHISEPQLIEAIRSWMDEEYQMDPFSIGIQLDFHEGEGIVAYIN